MRELFATLMLTIALLPNVAVAQRHADPTVITSMKALNRELKSLDATDNKFEIDYLNTIKSLRDECPNSAIFGQRLLVAYPTIEGAEGIKALAKGFYPDEVLSDDEVAVYARVQDYFDMVSNLDMDVAKSLLADDDRISIITPRSQFFGFEGITQKFLINTFSAIPYRKLSSLSEVANIFGSTASVQLYWKFETRTADGRESQTRGRETLLFTKIDNTWRLVHVHYSRMP